MGLDKSALVAVFQPDRSELPVHDALFPWLPPAIGGRSPACHIG
jgi:hypothetical protein